MSFYGQYRFKAVEVMQGHSIEELGEALTRSGLDAFDVFSAVTTVAVGRFVLAGKGQHLFISAQDRDIILHSVSKMDFKTLSAFAMDRAFGVLYVEGEPASVFMSHHEGERTVVFTNFEKEGSAVSLRSDEEAVTENMPELLKNRLRLIFGIGMMMQSFPEMFVDGPPASLKHPNWYRLLPNRQHLNIERIRKDMAPHLRRGHFRILTSDRFKFKKGMAVFVKAAMVKGHAKHSESA